MQDNVSAKSKSDRFSAIFKVECAVFIYFEMQTRFQCHFKELVLVPRKYTTTMRRALHHKKLVLARKVSQTMKMESVRRLKQL